MQPSFIGSEIIRITFWLMLEIQGHCRTADSIIGVKTKFRLIIGPSRKCSFHIRIQQRLLDFHFGRILDQQVRLEEPRENPQPISSGKKIVTYSL